MNCLECGKPVTQAVKGKGRRFCSRKCSIEARRKRINANPKLLAEKRKKHNKFMKKYRKDPHYRDAEKVWYWKEKLAKLESEKAEFFKDDELVNNWIEQKVKEHDSDLIKAVTERVNFLVNTKMITNKERIDMIGEMNWILELLKEKKP
jgi:hypothetical protein